MTIEQRSILATELDRVLGQLRTISPDTDGYHKCLDSAFQLMGFLDFNDNECVCASCTTAEVAFEPTPDERAADPENVEESSEAAREPEPEPAPAEESTPEPEPEPKPVTPAPKPEPRLTRQDMVSRLTYLANSRNVDVAAVMASLGFNRLSDVPESRYAELMDAANKAVQ